MASIRQGGPALNGVFGTMLAAPKAKNASESLVSKASRLRIAGWKPATRPRTTPPHKSQSHTTELIGHEFRLVMPGVRGYHLGRDMNSATQIEGETPECPIQKGMVRFCRFMQVI